MIYKCKNCGGNSIYNPTKKMMYCPHCESEESQEEYKGGSITSCVNCGAPISVDAYTSACKCEHCNSYLLFEERLEGEYEPHLILPFKLGREEVKEKLKKEFGSRAFTPASFSEEANLNKIEGLYVPFFLFDYHVDYQYSGIGTKVRTWVSGNTEYTETSRYDIHRELEIEFDKVPVDASIKMDDKTMDFMEPYNYKALEAFQKKYLSGFLGEMYNEQASHFENRAVDKIKSDSEVMMKNTMAGYSTISKTGEHINTKKEAANYALFPVWVYHYEYRGKTYSFHINGQTGKVIGTAPISRQKVFGYTATLFASCSIIIGLITQLLEVL